MLNSIYLTETFHAKVVDVEAKKKQKKVETISITSTVGSSFDDAALSVSVTEIVLSVSELKPLAKKN